MFHVKHNSSPLIQLVEKELEKSGSSISGIPTGLLPTILNKIKYKTIVFCDQEDVKTLTLSFEKKIGKNAEWGRRQNRQARRVFVTLPVR